MSKQILADWYGRQTAFFFEKIVLSFEANVALLLQTHSINQRVKKLEFGLLSVIRVKSAMRHKTVF